MARIADEHGLRAHYRDAMAPSTTAHPTGAGELALMHLEQAIRIRWIPLISQVRVSSLIVDMGFAAEHRAALVDTVNGANTEVGLAVFHLPNALFATHVAFIDGDRSVDSSVLDRSVVLVAESARGYGPLFRAIAAGSPERIPTLSQRAQRLAQAWLDSMTKDG